MNPLDLRGPQFLAFYLAYGAAVLLLLAAWRRRAEAGEGGRVNLSDPYLIAHLRGGRNEALRVAVLSLVDRGLLEVHGKQLRVRAEVTPEAVRRPIEKEIVAHFVNARDPATLFEAGGAGAAAAEFERMLTAEGLLPGEEQQRARRGRIVLGLALLLGAAFLKLVVALSRGRTNVLFLVVLAGAFALASVRVSSPRRTARGDALLGDLRTLFAGLRGRAASLSPGGATAEVALLAGVFGLGALPQRGWADVRALFRRGQASGETWGGSDGASCGSACGSSCGSSCGGGCGGGCGGCGS